MLKDYPIDFLTLSIQPFLAKTVSQRCFQINFGSGTSHIAVKKSSSVLVKRTFNHLTEFSIINFRQHYLIY